MDEKSPDTLKKIQHAAMEEFSDKGFLGASLRQIVKKAGENVFIPVKMKHRIQNTTDKNMEFIEVQTGETLDENDIIRYEDSYGRVG